MDVPQPYSFTQEPTGVRTRKYARKKYRDPFNQATEAGRRTYSLMHDRRIFRGNTYASQVMKMTEAQRQYEERQAKKQKAARRRIEAEKRRRQQLEREEKEKTEMEEIPPVEGRHHMEMQTDEFVEEITDRVIEKDVDTQTSPRKDRPASPKYIPRKHGDDKETQVEADLFDFEFEVQPLLEVLVGKTLEQSMQEVMQEEEIHNLKQMQLEFEQKRNAELAEVQRLEAEERRKYEEKERRKQQQKERLKKQQKAKQKLASRLFARKFLQNLEHKVVSSLEKKGFFYDVVLVQVEKDFMPWLMSSVEGRLKQGSDSEKMVDDLILEVIK